jgi:hypothetical protein
MTDRSIRMELARLLAELLTLGERRDAANAARIAGSGADVEALDAEISTVERRAAALLGVLEQRAQQGRGAGAAVGPPPDRKRRREGEEDLETGVRFAKITAIRSESRRVDRYTEAMMAERADIYASLFQADDPIILAAGPTMLRQFLWIRTQLDNIRKRNIEHEAEGREAETIGPELAFMIVHQRVFMQEGKVDGIPISLEHFEALVDEIRDAEPSYQFVHLRYFSPNYFEEAIRALRSGESPKDAASALLLGGA